MISHTINEENFMSLDMLRNELFYLKYVDGSLNVVSSYNDIGVYTVQQSIEELKLYGFDITVLRKATMSDIESICMEENINYVFGGTQRVRFFKDRVGNVIEFNRKLREYGYYF